MSFDLSEAMYNLLDNPLWDSSFLLADNSTLTSLTGYHATPSFVQFIAFLSYWALAFFLMYGMKQPNKILKNKVV